MTEYDAKASGHIRTPVNYEVQLWREDEDGLTGISIDRRDGWGSAKPLSLAITPDNDDINALAQALMNALWMADVRPDSWEEMREVTAPKNEHAGDALQYLKAFDGAGGGTQQCEEDMDSVELAQRQILDWIDGIEGLRQIEELQAHQCQTGDKYIVLAGGGIKSEGSEVLQCFDTPSRAAEDWILRFGAMVGQAAPNPTVYWRSNPRVEMMHSPKRGYSARGRFFIHSEPAGGSAHRSVGFDSNGKYTVRKDS